MAKVEPQHGSAADRTNSVHSTNSVSGNLDPNNPDYLFSTELRAVPLPQWGKVPENPEGMEFA